MITGILVVLMQGCIENLSDTTWDVEVITPLANSSLTFQNLVQDSVLEVGEADSLFVTVQENISPISGDDFVSLGFDPFVRTVKLDQLTIDDQTIEQNITLRDALTSVGLPCIPNLPITIVPINDVSVGPFAIDGSGFFKVMTLNDGFMDISISNGFPVAISNVEFIVINALGGDTVASGIIPNIPAGTNHLETINLAGKTVEGNLLASFTLDVNGSGVPVVLNCEAAINVKVDVYDLDIFSAEAIFPSQNVVENREEVFLEDMGDKELTYAFIESGQLRIRAVSTLEEELTVTYRIPNATKEGVPFEQVIVTPPAEPDGSVFNEVFFSFEGYAIDFTGLGDTTNAFYNELFGRIETSGEFSFLTREDSIDLIVEVIDLQASYVEGYLGQESFVEGPTTIKFDGLSDGVFENISFSGAELALVLENYTGMTAQLDISQLDARNSSKNTSQSIDLSQAGLPRHIAPATNGDPIVPERTTILLNDDNSNVSQVLDVNPDEISYQISVQTNYDDLGKSRDDFARLDNLINAFIEATFPVQIQTGDNGISFEDTASLKLEDGTILDQVQQGTLLVHANNGFPFELNMNFAFLDASDALLFTLLSTAPIQEAKVDPVNYKVTESVETTVEFALTKAQIDLLKDVHGVVINAFIVTQPRDRHLQIFDHYALDVQLVADFDYLMGLPETK